jgi:hypothetical protein
MDDAAQCSQKKQAKSLRETPETSLTSPRKKVTELLPALENQRLPPKNYLTIERHVLVTVLASPFNLFAWLVALASGRAIYLL